MLTRIEEEKGWAIMNGSKEEENKLWIYVGGKGESVIDYVVQKGKQRLKYLDYIKMYILYYIVFDYV